MNPHAHPLLWPTGWPRCKDRKPAIFGRTEMKFRRDSETGQDVPAYRGKVDLTMADAIKRVHTELGRLGVNVREDCVVSTNLALNLSGLPRGDQGEPSDPGVAVYWQAKGKPMTVMAVDRYTRVRDNLAAVAATLEAMRAIERHGGAQVLERAFAGFQALPAPKNGVSMTLAQAANELGLATGASEERINEAFRQRAKKAHPDNGGTTEAMQRLVAAREILIGAL